MWQKRFWSWQTLLNFHLLSAEKKETYRITDVYVVKEKSFIVQPFKSQDICGLTCGINNP